MDDDTDVIHVRGYHKELTSFQDVTQLCELMNRAIAHLTFGYVWYYGKPLEFFPASTSRDKFFLFASVTFDDCLDDQWFVAKIIVHLSVKFNEMCFTLENKTEQQFMLVECADYLPNFITPEIASKRTFVFRGQLCFIPLPLTPGMITFLGSAEPTDPFSALTILSKFHTQCQLAESVQQCLHTRLMKFNDLNLFTHRAHISVPASLGALLYKYPSLLCTLSHKFLRNGKPTRQTCDETFVKTAVVFPRLLYAQVISKRVNLPSSWPNKFDQSFVLGFKLWSSLKAQNKHLTDNYEHFMEKLREKGYFQDEIEGSMKYRELHENALKSLPPFCNDSLPALTKEDMDNFFSLQGPIPPQEDDSWLDISNEELDSALNSKYYTTDLKSIPLALNKFLSHPVEMLDGAEFPWSVSSEMPVKCDGNEIIKNLENLLINSPPPTDDDIKSSDDDSLFDEDDDILGPSYEGDDGEVLVKAALDSASSAVDPSDVVGPFVPMLSSLGIDLPLDSS